MVYEVFLHRFHEFKNIKFIACGLKTSVVLPLKVAFA